MKKNPIKETVIPSIGFSLVHLLLLIIGIVLFFYLLVIGGMIYLIIYFIDWTRRRASGSKPQSPDETKGSGNVYEHEKLE